ncbi:ANTAR domain-containing protein [Pedococcus sp. 5OH_020]|uniref:ANTAR domain-containing protein n=1 Tax=Pedococcus sp. 5OH_020 TaxID=2989814 RepID=UPI003FA6DB19
MSCRSPHRADHVRGHLDERALIERATGYIAETRGLDTSQAHSVLRAAAAEAGVAEVDAARAVLKGPSLASREPRN